MSEAVRSMNPTSSLAHRMPIENQQLGRGVNACFLGLKSHHYWGWLAGKCARVFHFMGNRFAILRNPWLTGKQHLSSRERWLLTLGLYR